LAKDDSTTLMRARRSPSRRWRRWPF